MKCVCCGLDAEADSSYCFICIGRGHDRLEVEGALYDFEAAQRGVTEAQLALGKLREAASGYDYLRSMAALLEAHIGLAHVAEGLKEKR